MSGRQGTDLADTRRIKLAIVVPTMQMGGAERCVSEILKHLDRDKYEIQLIMVFDRQIFYSVPGDISVEVLERDLLSAVESIPVEIPMELMGFKEDAIWLELTALKLAERINRFGADIVLARNIFSSVLCCLSRRYWGDDVGLIVSCDTYASRALCTHI